MFTFFTYLSVVYACALEGFFQDIFSRIFVLAPYIRSSSLYLLKLSLRKSLYLDHAFKFGSYVLGPSFYEVYCLTLFLSSTFSGRLAEFYRVQPNFHEVISWLLSFVSIPFWVSSRGLLNPGLVKLFHVLMSNPFGASSRD